MCCQNMQDIIVDYEGVFDFLVRRIRDPNHPFQPERRTTAISHTELLAGVENCCYAVILVDLLLHLYLNLH